MMIKDRQSRNKQLEKNSVWRQIEEKLCEKNDYAGFSAYEKTRNNYAKRKIESMRVIDNIIMRNDKFILVLEDYFSRIMLTKE